jgi:uncharacterized phage protein (TIGR02218 family)
MAAYLRSVSSPLALALAGGVTLWRADLFTFYLVDGVTILYFTSWDGDLLANGNTFSSRKPWVNRSGWNVSNKMEVPSLKITLGALNDNFLGGANIKLQMHNGLFDGASFLLQRAYMTTPGDTSALGTIDLFGGLIAGIDLDGIHADIVVKGKNGVLDQNAPRNIFQIGCNHAFCDAGCTLNRVTFTTAYTVGASPSTVFIPWSSAPADPDRYINGTIAFTSGAASGSRRNIAAADSSGLTLAYPLYALPLAGDGFTAFEGCDKSFDSGSPQSCTARSNTQHYRGFEFVPPPNAAF